MKATVLRGVAALALVLILAGGAMGAAPPRIENEMEPRFGSTTIELERLWNIGGDADDVLLGTIERVLTTDDGRIFLLDSQLSQVLECSPEGKVIQKVCYMFI